MSKRIKEYFINILSKMSKSIEVTSICNSLLNLSEYILYKCLTLKVERDMEMTTLKIKSSLIEEAILILKDHGIDVDIFKCEITSLLSIQEHLKYLETEQMVADLA